MTTAPAFEALDTQQQVQVLRDVARDAAPEFGLDVQGLALVLPGFNTTFEVVQRRRQRALPARPAHAG